MNINDELTNGFDILYNNISSNASPGLNEYEKSVILTKAQIEVLKNYFNPKGNKYKEGFDGSQKRQIDFSNLIKVIKPEESNSLMNSVQKMDERSTLYEVPGDVLFVLNETANVVYDGKYKHKVDIVPLRYDEYSMMVSKPFKQPYKHQGWRMINATSQRLVEVIVKEGAEISDYTMRYVRYPRPIILIDLEDEGLSIQGENKVSECELDRSLVDEILQRAVEIAKGAYTGDLGTVVQLGQRSE